MGPLAGLAAGLGLAALFSHLGLGDELASFMLIALAVAAAFFLFRFFMRRSAGAGTAPRLAAAGAPGGMSGGMSGGVTRQMPAAEPASAPLQRAATPVQADASSTGAAPAAFTGLKIGSNLNGNDVAGAAAVTAAPTAAALMLPEGFDRAGFERLARLIFIRMQAANDAADINDLRNFTTPELFAELRLDLQERGPAAQHTDVLEVQASVVDFAQEADRQVVSVRYQGRVQEAEGVPPEAFDEIWHLVKPVDDSRNWAIAGIQQAQ
jgi:predicted lipid-binding transport protein (Tim44 family)